MDALSLLGACVGVYGLQALEEFVSTIWSALKREVCAPLAIGLIGDDIARADVLSQQAAAVLHACAKVSQALR